MMLDQLPEDVVLLVVDHCKIAAVASLLSTCRVLRQILLSNMCLLVPKITQNTFPAAPNLLSEQQQDEPFTWDIMQRLKYNYLAAVLLDRLRTSWFRYEQYHGLVGIPASDNIGAEARKHIGNGFKVLDHLASVARHTPTATQLPVAPTRRPGILSIMLSYLSRRKRPPIIPKIVQGTPEAPILQRRIDHVTALPAQDVADFCNMWELLGYTVWRESDPGFHRAHYDKGPKYFDWEKRQPLNGPRSKGLFPEKISWVDWAVLNDGAQLFWSQWKLSKDIDTGSEVVIRERLLELWDQRGSCEVVERCRQSAIATLNVMYRRRNYGHPFWQDYLLGYAAKMGQDRLAGRPPPAETMGDVPFLVDFREPQTKAHFDGPFDDEPWGFLWQITERPIYCG